MAKVETVTHNIGGIKVAIPRTSGEQPTERATKILEASRHPCGWKYAVSAFHTYDKVLADELTACYDWFLGGHEIDQAATDQGILYRVTSKGYYHYVGS